MDLPPLGFVDDFIPIPPLFHSEQSGGPFETCVACDRALLVDGVQYIVEKAVRRGETIFEYALCRGCHEGLAEDVSRESTRRIEAHFGERVDLVDRRAALLARADDDADPWVAHCVLSKRPRSECEEYQVVAQCDGSDLLFTYMPFLIAGDAMEDLFRLLSKKTRETLDDFTGQHLGMPPEFAAPTTDPRLLIF
jgi:hypothetical protein